MFINNGLYQWRETVRLHKITHNYTLSSDMGKKLCFWRHFVQQK